MRNKYSMPHLNFNSGKIGGLQCLLQFPCIAGDSINFDMTLVHRMSPYRREVVLQPRIELFAFWVPHRHIYSNWKEFLEGGYDESVTLASTNIGSDAYHYLGGWYRNTIPAHTLAGYNRIWNRYFRYPADESGEVSDTGMVTKNSSNNEVRQYGYTTCWPKNAWNTGLPRDEVTDSDSQVDVVNGVIDVKDIEKARAQYGSEVIRDWFAADGRRYKDILKVAFGVDGVNTDADQRPTLLSHKKVDGSSMDISATGTNIGQASGRGISQISFGFPRKYFNEHGNIYIMMLTRYDQATYQELPYLNAKPNLSYLDMAGDPRLIAAEPPIRLKFTDYHAYGSDYVPGTTEYVPYGQQYRYYPTLYAGEDYSHQDGYPFFNSDEFDDNFDRLHYITPSFYDDLFQSTVKGHYQTSASCMFDVDRIVPDINSSIFTGAN